MRSPTPAPLAAFYLTNFAILGIYLPYFTLYLQGLGMTAWQIGVLVAAVPIGKIVCGPLWTLWADRSGMGKGLVVLSTGLAAAVFALVLASGRFAPLCAILYLYAAMLAPQLPIVEAITLDLAERHRWQYGRIRAWGSLGFILAALLGGALFDVHPLSRVVPLLLALMALNLATAVLLPAGVGPRAPGDLVPDARPVAAGAAPFFACTLLMQASHGAYYAFFSIVLEEAGYRRGTIGALWASGVIAEIVTMVGAGWLLARLGVAALFTVCLALAALRWGICASTVWLPAIMAAQVLHAFTFGAFHVAGVIGTHRLFPPSLRASGQSLYSGFTYGAGNVIGFLGAGALFGWGGTPWLFGVSAATAVLGLGCSLPLWRVSALRSPDPAAALGILGGID
jgi:MFS transporter, PPP family, 3-phenylpropionic acid transporter